MLNLAPIKYAKVMEAAGGPIARMEHARVDIFGQSLVHAVTYLREGIVDAGYLKIRATEQPDGAGCHASVQIACYMAISEGLERWAVHYCREQKEAKLGGIHIDGSSNGFAAFPGVFRRQARGAAFRESIERHCLICWWEGLLSHKKMGEPVLGISAIEIDNPFSKDSVVIIWSDTAFGPSYAFGAGRDPEHAAKRALVELGRTQKLLEKLNGCTEPLEVGKRGDVFERRILYFSMAEGSELFFSRVHSEVTSVVSDVEILFDAPVVGPWDRYAGVWRTIIAAPNTEYLSPRADYFFW